MHPLSLLLALSPVVPTPAHSATLLDKLLSSPVNPNPAVARRTDTDYTGITNLTASANAVSWGPAVDDDGDKIVFATSATNLATGAGIILYNVSLNTYTLCSSGYTAISRPSISRDGAYVGFWGNNGTTSGPCVYNVGTPGITMGPVGTYDNTSLGSPADLFPPSISNSVSGHYYAVYEDQGNIDLWQIDTSTETVISNTSTSRITSPCAEPVIDTNADKVAFVSSATGLTTSGAPSGSDWSIYETTLNSGSWYVTQYCSNGCLTFYAAGVRCFWPTISGDGNTVAFTCMFTNTTTYEDVNVWTESSGTASLPYPNHTEWANGAPWNTKSGTRLSRYPSISTNGNVLAYDSWHYLSDYYWVDYAGCMEEVYITHGLFVEDLTTGAPPAYLETYHYGTSPELIRTGMDYITGSSTLFDTWALSSDGSTFVFSSCADRIPSGSYYPSYTQNSTLAPAVRSSEGSSRSGGVQRPRSKLSPLSRASRLMIELNTNRS